MRGIFLLFIVCCCVVSLKAQTTPNLVVENRKAPGFVSIKKSDTDKHIPLFDAVISKDSSSLNPIHLNNKAYISNSLYPHSEDSNWQLNKRKDKEIAIPLNDIRFQNIALNTMPVQRSGFNILPTGELITRTIYASGGLPQRDTQFFIDGIPMEYFGGLYSVNALPISSIDKFELHNKVKPINLLSDEYGGAINFRTMLEGDDNLDFSYSYGLYNTHQMATSGFSRDKLSGLTFRGVGFFNYSDNDYKVWEGENYLDESDIKGEDRTAEVRRFNDAYYNIGGKMDLGFTDTSFADQVYLSFWFGHKYDEVQHGATMDVPFGRRYYRQETMMPSLTYQKNNLFWKGFDVSVYTGFSAKHTDINDISNFRFNWLGEKENDSDSEDKIAELNYFDDNTIINRTVLDYKISKKHAVTLSTVFENLQRTSDNLKVFEEDQKIKEKHDLEKDIIALAYKNTSEDKGLETSFFGKYYGYKVNLLESEYDEASQTYVPNDYSKRNNNFGYGVLVKYEFNKQLFFQSSFERAVTMPNADMLFGNESTSVLTAFRNDFNLDLEPEVSKNTYLSIFYKNDSKKDHLIHIGTHITFRNVKNYIQANITREKGMDYYFYENHEKIQSKEVQFQVDYTYRNMLDVSISASYLNAHNNSVYDNDGDENKYFNSRLKNEPYFHLNTGVNFRTFYDIFMQDTQFTFSWNMRFIQEYLNEWELIGGEDAEMIPSQFINNFGVMYGFPNNKVFFSLEGRNVFDVPVFDNYGNQQTGRGIYAKILLNL